MYQSQPNNCIDDSTNFSRSTVFVSACTSKYSQQISNQKAVYYLNRNIVGLPNFKCDGDAVSAFEHSAVILGALTLVTALFGAFLSKTALSRLFFIYAFLGFLVVAAFSFTVFETQELEGCSGHLALMHAVVFAGLGYAKEGILAQEIGGIWSLAGLWSSAYRSFYFWQSHLSILTILQN